jgi:membrane protein
MAKHSTIQKLRSGLDLKGGGQLLKTTFNAWVAQDPFRQSATIAYYAIFSLPALLVIIISVAGFFFGHEAVTGQLSRNINRMMGADTAKQIENMVAQASISDKSGWATLIAVVVMFIGSTAVFVQLQKTFNIIWQVKPKLKGKFLMVLKARLLSFGLVLTIGFLLLISLVITSLVALFGTWLETKIPVLAVTMLQILNFIFSFGLITVLFAMMFKFLRK